MATDKKGERIYLLGSRTLDESNKPHYFIKIGRTGDLRARMRNYETYNPSFLKFGDFGSPSRAYSEAIENALLTAFVVGRQKKTEWFEVDYRAFESFQKLSTLKEVLSFVGIEHFFNMKIEVFRSRAFEEERPFVRKQYEAKAESYEVLRGQVG